jgi:hypothetical protein
LHQLPRELGQLPNLMILDLNNNPHLAWPPPEVVARGIGAVLAFLRDIETDAAAD